jgi:hypothetical protein
MNKRLLALISLVVAVGAIAWMAIMYYVQRPDGAPALTDQERGLPAEEQPVPAPIGPTNIVRVAVGGLGLPDDRSENVQDLITAQLSGAKGIELVDRKNLNQILREQALSLSGVVRSKDAVRVGNLLHADWFMVGSAHQLNGTNFLVARIVDVGTGVMRDIDVFPLERDPLRMSGHLSQFVRRARETASGLKPHPFLAFGAFADVGVNSRQQEFPGQLRAYLTGAYRNENVTLLERESVSALLEEMRLDQAGMTETTTKNAPLPLAAAVWLVNGYFQSFETTNFQVEVMIQAGRVFGDMKTATLRGRPEDIPPQAKKFIDGLMASPEGTKLGGTRRMEIARQLDMGKALLTRAWGHAEGISQVFPGPSDPRRTFNVEEARRTYETVLALDPSNREARFFLAECLSDWTVGRCAEAGAFFQELTNVAKADEWSKRARFVASALTGMSGPLHTDEVVPVDEAERQLLDKIRTVGPSTLYEFKNRLGKDASTAGDRLANLWPKLKGEFPDRAPYLLAIIVILQGQTNSPLVAEFRQLIASAQEYKGPAPEHHGYYLHFQNVYQWAWKSELYQLALEVMESKRRISAKTNECPFEREDSVRVGYAYAQLGRWHEALDTFVALGDEPVGMRLTGPWGSSLTFLPGDATAACRKKLGLSPLERSNQFTFGSSLGSLPARGCFAVADNSLWICIDGKLRRRDLDLHTNLEVNLPVPAFVPIRILYPVADRIWIGTESGLVQYDKGSGKCRLLTQKDGLLRDDISSLLQQDQTLWIGYGSGGPGGFGKLDLLTGRPATFAQPLPAQALDLAHGISAAPANQPPAHSIAGLTPGPGKELWMLAVNGGIRSYNPISNSWGAPPGAGGLGNPGSAGARNTLACLSSDDERAVVGVLIQLDEVVSKETSPRHWVSTVKPGPENGGLAIYDFQSRRWRELLPKGDLLHPPTLIQLDGRDIWAAGPGYVAVVDSAVGVVRKLCYIRAGSVDRIQVASGYLWAQFDDRLYRVPLSQTR